MKYVKATNAKNQFGVLLQTVDREPVTIEKNGQPVAVVVSINEYESANRRKNEVNNFIKKCQSLRAEAKENGMTKEDLDSILKS